MIDSQRIFWKEVNGRTGIHLFSFDKKKYYNFFRDYPYKLNAEELRITIEEGGLLGGLRLERAKEYLKEQEEQERKQKHR